MRSGTSPKKAKARLCALNTVEVYVDLLFL